MVNLNDLLVPTLERAATTFLLPPPTHHEPPPKTHNTHTHNIVYKIKYNMI